MTLRARLATLERGRPAIGPESLWLDMAADVAARVEAAKAAGTFPRSVAPDDLLAVVRAADVARGRA